MEPLLEELALNAWPAVRQVHYDNWVLRFSGGHTRRANSVNVLGPSSIPLHKKISFCEDAYMRASAPTVFKFSGISGTEDLEDRLSDAGYQVEGNATVMTRDLTQIGSVPDADFRVEHELSTAWFDQAVRLSAVDKSRVAAFEKILSNIVPTRSFASVWEDGKVAGIGIAVIERGWAGLFDIVVAPEYRRKGHGARLILNMLRWANDNAAQHAYLQVAKGNEPASRLYDSLGFKPAYEYWYRVK